MDHLDRYLMTSVPVVRNLQINRSQHVRERVEDAISRFDLASLDCYNSISTLSTYWQSDDTGSAEDSSLFLETISKLKTNELEVKTCTRIIAEEEKALHLMKDVNEKASTMTGKRKLFILHYAGHGVASNTSNELTITSRIAASEKEIVAGSLNMTLIKSSLKDLASYTNGLDILLIMDCCCAAAAGRGVTVPVGQRMELMAATSDGGISNSRKDGITFTQYWCQAFLHLLDFNRPFTCNEIKDLISTYHGLEQFPATFVLREGWGAPIRFKALPDSTAQVPAAVANRAVITALHVTEDCDSANLDLLINYLEHAPVPITVLAVLPFNSSLIFLRVPLFLQEMLVLPQISFLIDA